MKSLIGICKDHHDAIKCIQLLKENGFTSKNLSLLTKANEEGEFQQEVKNANTAVVGLGLGAVTGTTLGVLAGIGILAIPGLGFLVGAGAVAGAVAGFDFGVIGGGLISALAIKGLEKEMSEKYQQQLEAGDSLVIVEGEEDELIKAKEIMERESLHMKVNVH